VTTAFCVFEGRAPDTPDAARAPAIGTADKFGISPSFTVRKGVIKSDFGFGEKGCALTIFEML
jgi:hypothetical protein